MLNSALMDLYSDYLLTSFNLSTATGMSNMLDGAYSHDQISRFLAQPTLGPKDYWKSIKAIVRKVESNDGIICIDDFIIPKPHSTMNEMVNYHFDHTQGKSVRGINVISFLYHSNAKDVQLPIAYELVRKPIIFTDPKTGKQKRKSEVSKNEMVQDRLTFLTQRNHVKYKYALFDTWFSSNENFKLIHNKLKKCFISAIKKNRLVALSMEDKLKGEFVKVGELELQTNSTTIVYFKGLDFPVQLTKQVFTNKDNSTGELFLVSNDLELSFDDQTTIYKKRWKVEEFHKSAKQNASLGKSPTKYEVTQSNHIFCSMISVCKLELLKIKYHKNHFAIKSQLYLKAIKAAYDELQLMKLTAVAKTLQKQHTVPLLTIS